MDRDRDNDRNRNFRYEEDDRGLGDRAMDEMRSWFGDEEAERRRRLDQMERDRYRDDMERGRGSGYGRGWDMDRNRHLEGYRHHEWGGTPRAGSDWSGRYGAERGVEDMYGRGGSAGAMGGGFGRGPGERGTLDDFGSRYGGAYGRDHGPGEQSTDRPMGRFWGRGPKGYQRSADRIMEDANEALTWAGDVDAEQIQVTVEGDEVILEGTVDSRHEKRAAEEAVERVRGVKDVHNRLRVQPQAGEQAKSSTMGEQAKKPTMGEHS